MVHGRDRSAVSAAIIEANARCNLDDYPHAVLFSRRRFKQAGASYFSGCLVEGVAA
jgi:siroheme decarboxylase